MKNEDQRQISLQNYILAGGIAGITVDAVFFPLDTLKTRLQSKEGLKATGGLLRLYSGLSSTLLGSAPSAAMFFLTYECFKKALGDQNMVALAVSSSLSEISACTVRVPVEVVKQRMQVGRYKQMNVFSVFKDIFLKEGIFGLYRGFTVTIQREIPFSAIQFPIYERLKRHFGNYEDENGYKTALCGSIAGGFTAFITTPLDVFKTRTMLCQSGGNNVSLTDIWRAAGLKGLFAGAIPRVLWISVGGFIFFGTYEKIKNIL